MRSIYAKDYQDIPRPVAAMTRDYEPGSGGRRHQHRRAQLLHAISGTMSLIEHRAAGNASIRQLCALGSDAVARGASITARLLAFGRRSNLRIEVRWGGYDADRIKMLAKELVDLRPDAILGQTTPVIAALAHETRVMPRTPKPPTVVGAARHTSS